jgi:hypothetical protein
LYEGYPRGQSLQYPMYRRLRRREKSSAGYGTRIFSHPTISLVAIQAELSRFYRRQAEKYKMNGKKIQQQTLIAGYNLQTIFF